ncbi:MAG: hypothetical protein CVU19_10855 [Betaproteobacteria bacterium HGW-Betaproteobacteria-13]|nr:MAG: hypothetical protein CVU25_05345 [Betaproteobacteria bacterium HGW-Betaproteobacteria-19]PKO80722.1 MAG: hypothetical protein CVU19_10855 [Betaproteobacteria bacterium HGW-Betaproteobacteria-13]
MRPHLSMIALGIALAVTCSSPASVHAEVFVPTVTDEARNDSIGFGSAPLDESVLENQRGGSDLHLSEIRAVGNVSEVESHNVITGHNIVSDGALAGASGMPMFIQNSGNGVLIQNAVILNVEVK